MKKPRHRSGKARARFANEARETSALQHHDGVIRVFDVDPDPEPSWYVCELGDTLAAHLGDAPDLWDVVAAVSKVASTLADLADAGVHHRDVKPDNLLFARSRPIVADFGIAHWPGKSHLTGPAEKVGPMYFLAPEMRTNVPAARPGPADVYALAKTLFVLALPERGQFPPGGTHYVGAPEFSLYRAGQRASNEIGSLLESATAEQPSHRPSMRTFHEELTDWLRYIDRPSASRPTNGFRRGLGPEFDAEMARIARQRRNLQSKLRDIGVVIAQRLGLLVSDLDWEVGETGDLAIDYSAELSWPPDDGAEVFVCFRSGVLKTGRRAVIAGGVFQSTVTYFAEVQSIVPGGLASVSWRCAPLVEAELEHPSGTARLIEVTERLVDEMRRPTK